MNRRDVLAGLAAAAATTVAGTSVAQDASVRSYAVLSLLGDKLTLVANDGNFRQESIPLSDTLLDADALRESDAAIMLRDKGAKVTLMFAPSLSYYSGHARFFEPGGAVSGVLAGVRNTQSTHLIVFTKFRDEAEMQGAGRRIGKGDIEGLGFYVDTRTVVQEQKTYDDVRGFYAVFAYMRASLVDVATGEVVSSRTIKQVITFTRGPRGGGWNSLGPDEKLDLVRGLLRQEISKAVGELIR